MSFFSFNDSLSTNLNLKKELTFFYTTSEDASCNLTLTRYKKYLYFLHYYKQIQL